MRYYSIILFCFALLSTMQATSQKMDRTWVFGDSVGIDFNDLNNPTPFVSKMWGQGENVSCISDSSGNLLLFLHGKNFFFTIAEAGYNLISSMIHNADTLVENGDSLFSDYSETQGSVIVPAPGGNNIYYIFYLTYAHPYTSPLGGLYYAVIDMNLNAGKGKVLVKNVDLVEARLSEKLQAVKHANGRDWWIVAHSQGDDRFYKILLDATGVHGPFTQHIGGRQGDTTGIGDKQGQMTFSRDGEKLLTVNRNGLIDVFDFDRCTGQLSNWVSISEACGMTFSCSPNNGYLNYYGSSFSNDGRYAYISSYPFINPNYGETLYQIDLMAVDIGASAQVIHIDSNISHILQHQIGPDGKIYISSSRNIPSNSWIPPYDSFNTYLSVIHQPDSPGLACDFRPYSFSLNGRRIFDGLPNMPNYNLDALPAYKADAGKDRTICAGEVTFLGRPAQDGIIYFWHNNPSLYQTDVAQPIAAPDSNTMYVLTIIDTVGTYSCIERNDTVWVFVEDRSGFADVTSDTSICPGDSVVLTASGGQSYTWLPSPDLSSLQGSVVSAQPTTAATYSVIVTDNIGCKDTATVAVAVFDPVDTPAIMQQENSLYTIVAATAYQWSLNGDQIPGANQQLHTPAQNGLYTVQTWNSDGCSATSESYFYELTGLESVQPNALIKIFPNPAYGVLFIESMNGIASIEVFNVVADKVKYYAALSAGINELDVSQLANGLYYLRIELKQTHQVVYQKVLVAN